MELYSNSKHSFLKHSCIVLQAKFSECQNGLYMINKNKLVLPAGLQSESCLQVLGWNRYIFKKMDDRHRYQSPIPHFFFLSLNSKPFFQPKPKLNSLSKNQFYLKMQMAKLWTYLLLRELDESKSLNLSKLSTESGFSFIEKIYLYILLFIFKYLRLRKFFVFSLHK